MAEISIIGLDLAKSVFQVHAADASGAVVFRKRLRRSQVLPFFSAQPPCTVAMEACGSAHHWAREMSKLGHYVRLIPPAYVKPFVKRQKSDAADAEAICEALTRPSMRFVPVKNLEQQSALLLHRTRDLLVAQRTQLANALRGHLAELGVVTAKGIGRVRELVTLLAEANDDRVPPLAREVLMTVVVQLREVEQKITELERQLLGWHRTNEVSRRLATIAGVGPITATALVATVGDPAYFRSGRQFAAWLGLVPRQRSSGGKEWLGGISKRGDGYLRRLLVHGGRTVVRWQKRSDLAGRASGAASGQRRHRRPRQQKRTDRVGADDPGRDLPSRIRSQGACCVGRTSSRPSRWPRG
jgi:transposase